MGINKARVLIDRYNKPKKKGFGGGLDDLDSSNKWVEYSLDLIELKKLAFSSDFSTRFEIERTIKKVESKIDWMYKHKNFNLNTATTELKRARRLLKY